MRRIVRAASRRMARVVLCTLLAAALVPMPASAIDVVPEPTTYYVDVMFEGSADGSIDAPFPTIAEALDEALSGDTILVAAGTYSPETGEEFPLVLQEGLTLKSIAGSSETTIDAQFSDRAIVYGDAEPVSLEPAPYVPEDPILIEGFAVTQGSMEEGGCMLL
ncbi:MAG: DUF1565 domain-containing protein, partial [Actinomycetota bacterium]|nr:DUF1565 domain-containing protein [Actinomycetota bacterium]